MQEVQGREIKVACNTCLIRLQISHKANVSSPSLTKKVFPTSFSTGASQLIGYARPKQASCDIEWEDWLAAMLLVSCRGCTKRHQTNLPTSGFCIPAEQGIQYASRPQLYLLETNSGCWYVLGLLPSVGQRRAPVKANAQSTSIGQPLKYGLMIECDGVLVDIHKDCHRVAFNMAFEVSFV